MVPPSVTYIYGNSATYASLRSCATPKMTVSNKVFSLEGKSLKLTSAEDLEPHIKELRDMEDVEEVRLLGNTLGIGACKLLGEILSTKKNLRVRYPRRRCLTRMPNHLVAFRSPTSRISSRVASSMRSPRLSASSSTQSSTSRSSTPST